MSEQQQQPQPVLPHQHPAPASRPPVRLRLKPNRRQISHRTELFVRRAYRWSQRIFLVATTIVVVTALVQILNILHWVFLVAPNFGSLLSCILASIAGVFMIYGIWRASHWRLLAITEMPGGVEHVTASQRMRWYAQAIRSLRHHIELCGREMPTHADIEKTRLQNELDRLMTLSSEPLDGAKGAADIRQTEKRIAELLESLDCKCQDQLEQLAVKAAAGTAASPYPLVDGLIVLWFACRAVQSVIALYGGIPRPSAIARILAEVCIAVQFAVLTQRTQKTLSSLVARFVTAVIPGGQVVDGLVEAGSWVAVQGTMAAANGFLVLQIGFSTQRTCLAMRTFSEEEREEVAREVRERAMEVLPQNVLSKLKSLYEQFRGAPEVEPGTRGSRADGGVA